MRSSFLIIWHFRICFSTFGKALISYKAILDVIRLIAYNDTDIKICRKIFSNDKYRRVVWQCNHKFDGGEKCTTPHLDEETIKRLFIKALNIIGKEKDLILVGFGEVKDTAFETGELEAEARQLNGEMNVAAELIQKCIGENARVVQNQGEYAKRYDALVGRFETAKLRLEEVQAAITEKQAQRKIMENFMDVLRGLPEQVDYFDEAAWYAMVDFMTVYGKDDVRFTFKNGMEIKA